MHYIHTKEFSKRGENRLRALQNAIFSDAEKRVPVDAARLKIMVKDGEISPEQERRLLDIGMRTRVGMGCKDAFNPPPSMAAGHRPGHPCVVQRCIGCAHGVVFDDSLHLLARRMVELEREARSMPTAAWLKSSLPAEESSIRETLSLFPPDKLAAVVSEWRNSFEDGHDDDRLIFPAP